MSNFINNNNDCQNFLKSVQIKNFSWEIQSGNLNTPQNINNQIFSQNTNIEINKQHLNFSKPVYKNQNLLKKQLRTSRDLEYLVQNKNQGKLKKYQFQVNFEQSLKKNVSKPKSIKQIIQEKEGQNIDSLFHKSLPFQIQNNQHQTQPPNVLATNLLKKKSRNFNNFEKDITLTTQTTQNKEINFFQSVSSIQTQKETTHLEQTANLNKIGELLQRMFCNEPISQEQLKLEPYQLEILIKILERRFKIEIKKTNTTAELRKLIETLLEKYTDSFIRSEEKYKFVLKKSIRLMKIWIKDELSSKGEPSTTTFVNKRFLSKYFGELASKFGVNIKIFTPPTNINFKTAFKTVNKEYIDLIKKSDLFMKDFFFVIENELIPFYAKEIKEKFSLLTKQLEERLKEADGESFSLKVEQIKNFISNKKRLKLPWDLQTVRNSINLTVEQFKQLNLLNLIQTLNQKKNKNIR